jgi:Fe-S oxidoreductase
LVADPGCAVLLGPGRSVTPVELAARQLESFKPISFAEAAPLRWHDPCQLGRGLGQYQAPRAVLTRLLGGAPEEFICRREHASCSGAGALLPLTMPRHAARIADARIAEHRRLGGGTIVTACGSALRRFRARGAPALDLVTLMRRSLVGDG